MPLTKVTNKAYLANLVSLAPTILAEYKATLETTARSKPKDADGWKLVEIMRNRNLLPNAEQIPTLKTFIENLPDNVYPVMVTISASEGTVLQDKLIHNEPYPNSLHRYHITLQACDYAFIHIQEDNIGWQTYTWENGFAYEFENPQNNHYISHNTASDDRIIIMLDVFEDIEPTLKETSTHESIIQEWIINVPS